MKSLKFGIIVLLACFFFISCSAKHEYNLLIKSSYNEPVVDAKVDYKISKDEKVAKIGSYVTKEDGRFGESVSIESAVYGTTCLYYEVTKDGYYTESGDMNIPVERFLGIKDGSASETITLSSPIDYLTRDFAKSVESSFIKEQISPFIDWVRYEALLADTILEFHSIDIIDFKEKKYLTFKFVNTNVYNSLKLSKYDIGRQLFDEVVRKILNPLNEYLRGSELFYGYDIKVIGHTKSFADEYATPEEIEYRFMMPEPVVKAYKDKDITGQTVLNQSIILMDDERIELELQ